MKRNTSFSNLREGYLFPEVIRRVAAYRKEFPQADVIHLGIGDTSQPIPPHILGGLVDKSKALGTQVGYTGYGPEEGELRLREQVAKTIYKDFGFTSEEVTISDGANCDISRLQVLFGGGRKVAVPDPTYPVYLDSSLMMGHDEIVFLPCTEKNNFFPDFSTCPPVDLIFICSPNNPTGSIASFEELKKAVDFAKKNRSIIIFDAAYAAFIKGTPFPSSIYEIPGAKEVAIEVGTLSKRAGFSGVRLGWCIVPKELKYENGQPVLKDWLRVVTTLFNGASNISQEGAMRALSDVGEKETEQLIGYYHENIALLKKGLKAKGYKVFGSDYIPFLWVQGEGDSWGQFDRLLQEKQIVTTPGSGFGPSGEGYLRFSCLGKREKIQQALDRL